MRYLRRDGFVYLAGCVPAGEQPATLPAGYRPALDHMFITHADGAVDHARVMVRSTGQVEILTPEADVFVDGVIFVAEQ